MIFAAKQAKTGFSSYFMINLVLILRLRYNNIILYLKKWGQGMIK